MPSLLFRHAALFDGSTDRLHADMNVLVRDEAIAAVSKEPIDVAADTRIVDLQGRTLMPGLIDAHFHAVLGEMSTTAPADVVKASLERALSYGFTTLRDAGGADRRLQLAVQAGLIEGPRLFVAGRVLSPTGGPGDSGIDRSERCRCCADIASHADVVDGVKGLAAAVRAAVAGGADHIKITSTDDAFSDGRGYIVQYSEPEIAAATGEAIRLGRYVMAHAYRPQGIVQAARAGVRSIEHAPLINAEAAAICAERGTYVVPTLARISMLYRAARDENASESLLARLDSLRDAASASLDLLKRANARIGFGSDLTALSQEAQGEEFQLRAAGLPAVDILRSATSINGRLMGQSTRLGCIVPGAVADLIVVDGNPLASIGLLAQQGKHVSLVMKGGRICRSKLD